MTGGASIVGPYRYHLWRHWGSSENHFRLVTWIMLNPSTADAAIDDATIRRCIGYTKAWGFDGLEVVNLFALRATSPEALQNHPDPIGPKNNEVLAGYCTWRPHVIAAWGAWGKLNGRAAEVETMLTGWTELKALAVNKDGTPAHPLYLPRKLQPRLLSELRAAL